MDPVLGDPSQCYICETKTAAIEEHHILPRAQGGELGPRAYLCSNCHTLIHKQALNVVSGPNTEKVQYFPEAQMQRAIPFIRVIAQAIRDQKRSPDFFLPYTLQLKTTKGVIALLHLIKIDSGYSSLNRYLVDLIENHVKEKYPTLANQIPTLPKSGR